MHLIIMLAMFNVRWFNRIGEQTAARLDDCNRLLWSEQHLAEHESRDVRRNFTYYRECQIDLRKLVWGLFYFSYWIIKVCMPIYVCLFIPHGIQYMWSFIACLDCLDLQKLNFNARQL
jgi:hypothetical protein